MGTTSPTPSFIGYQAAVGTMYDVFHWRVRVAREMAYAKRAEECRLLAKVCPEHLRQGYLKMAVEYERLAKKAEE